MKPGLTFITLMVHLLADCSLLEAQTSTCKDSLPGPVVITKAEAPTDSSRQKSWLFKHAQLSGGQITLPFKIRRVEENHSFKLTTDVTLGGFIGYTRKIGGDDRYVMTVPLTAGLTFINLNDDNTAVTRDADDSNIVAGLTWSTGIVFQLDHYSLGLMLGKDYASDIGDDWTYNGKMWWSFGIGFMFLK